jgi:protein dithiol:quinone oxidoreductase
MLHTLSSRTVFVGLGLLAIVAMLFARLYLQQHLGLAACPLCMTQRVFMVLSGVIALLGAAHNPRAWGRRVYGALCGLSAIAGAAVAARHVWLQHLPADQVPACGPSLEYMLENLPFHEMWSVLLAGDGNCAEIQWTFLGFSIPEQTLVVFGVMILICLWQVLRTYPDQR